MAVGAGASKKELFLQATMEEQRELITKYEKKIGDLVRAYKSLSKEKEALQVSLAALKENLPAVETMIKEENTSSTDDVDRKQDSRPSDENNTETQSEDSHSENIKVKNLERMVATLTSSLHTLTEERNSVENSLKEDRKKLLSDKKKIEDELRFERDEWQKSKNDYEAKLHDVRNRLIVSQHEREQEASNGIIMLREVESRLAKERSEKEKLEKMVDDLKDHSHCIHEKKQQKQISDLRNELEQVRCRLKKAEEHSKEPPVLKQLQIQMEEMKLQYTEAINQEKLRAEAADKSVRELTEAHEKRVVSLETSLSELSHTIANYDKTRNTHVQTIASLKEKIAELSEENIVLTSSQTYNTSFGNVLGREATFGIPEHIEDSDVNVLIEMFVSLWEKIEQKQKYKTSFSVEDLLSRSEVIHKNCIIKYKELNREIENLREKTAMDPGENHDCTCVLREHLDEARERIRSLNAAEEMTRVQHSQQVAQLLQEIKTCQLKQEEEKCQLEYDNKVAISNLEQQLTEHCQRSLMTLHDRDEEIHRLSQETYRLTEEANTKPLTVAAALLSQVTSGADRPLLHHLEELARKELEVTDLRREKIQLEKSLREIQMKSIDKQQQMNDTIESLQEEVSRLHRNTSREGENMEYVKNVVLQYMTSADVESRRVILRAIAAVLKFTEQETESARRCLSLWWWQAPSKSTPTPPLSRSRNLSGNY